MAGVVGSQTREQSTVCERNRQRAGEGPEINTVKKNSRMEGTVRRVRLESTAAAAAAIAAAASRRRM